MDFSKITPRSVAKHIAKSAVAIKTSQIAEGAITDYTGFEKDDMVVKITTGFIGGYVAYRLSPVTDYAVDKVADFIVAKREDFKTKKNEKPEEK